MYGNFANAGIEISANEWWSRRNKVFESLCIEGQIRSLGAEPPAAGGYRRCPHWRQILRLCFQNNAFL